MTKLFKRIVSLILGVIIGIVSVSGALVAAAYYLYTRITVGDMTENILPILVGFRNGPEFVITAADRHEFRLEERSQRTVDDAACRTGDVLRDNFLDQVTGEAKLIVRLEWDESANNNKGAWKITRKEYAE